ncbi:hypothetical protein N9Z83_02990 [Akkermansiaceae bacterium]|nr:hypothetical protein [Akkermansiaceae bacterium]
MSVDHKEASLSSVNSNTASGSDSGGRIVIFDYSSLVSNPVNAEGGLSIVCYNTFGADPVCIRNAGS